MDIGYCSLRDVCGSPFSFVPSSPRSLGPLNTKDPRGKCKRKHAKCPEGLRGLFVGTSPTLPTPGPSETTLESSGKYRWQLDAGKYFCRAFSLLPVKSRGRGASAASLRDQEGRAWTHKADGNPPGTQSLAGSWGQRWGGVGWGVHNQEDWG